MQRLHGAALLTSGGKSTCGALICCHHLSSVPYRHSPTGGWLSFGPFSTHRRFCSSSSSLGNTGDGKCSGTGKVNARRMSITIRSSSQRTPYRTPPNPIASCAVGADPTHPAGSNDGACENRPSSSSGSDVGRRGSIDSPRATGMSASTMRSLSHFTEPVKRILFVRNGRSEANEDVSAYVSTPDWRIPLVESGKQECVQVGRRLAELVGDEPVYVYYSPYIRSRQSLRYVLQGYDEGRQATPDRHEWWEDCESIKETDVIAQTSRTVDVSGASSLHGGGAAERAAKRGLQGPEGCSTLSQGIVSPSLPTAVSPALTPRTLRDPSLILRSGSNNRIIGVREDVRLRDGDIGRYRTAEELVHHLEERERYGKFFYRFPHGESGADVCDRVTSFLDAFQRERVEFPMNTNVVVITHGLTIRMLIKRWFHLTVDTFHKMNSPPSGSIVTLTRLHHRSCFRMDESCVEDMNLPLSLNEHNGYKYRNKQLLGSMSSGAPYM